MSQSSVFRCDSQSHASRRDIGHHREPAVAVVLGYRVKRLKVEWKEGHRAGRGKVFPVHATLHLPTL